MEVSLFLVGPEFSVIFGAFYLRSFGEPIRAEML